MAINLIRLECANVATKDNVAPENGSRGHGLVNGVRDNTGSHGELHRGGVDDADDVSRPRCLKDSKEGSVEAVLGVKQNIKNSAD